MSSVSVNNTFVVPSGNKSAAAGSITGAKFFESVASSNDLNKNKIVLPVAASGSKSLHNTLSLCDHMDNSNVKNKYTLPRVRARSPSPVASGSMDDGFVLVGSTKNKSSPPPSDGVVDRRASCRERVCYAV